MLALPILIQPRLSLVRGGGESPSGEREEARADPRGKDGAEEGCMHAGLSFGKGEEEGN